MQILDYLEQSLESDAGTIASLHLAAMAPDSNFQIGDMTQLDPELAISDSRPQEIAAGALVLSGVVAAPPAYRYGAPAMLMGLLLGLSCRFLGKSDRFARASVGIWAMSSVWRRFTGVRLSVGDVAASVGRRCWRSVPQCL